MGHDSCCVVNCNNTGRNSNCKFYRFPTPSCKQDQRIKWIAAHVSKNSDCCTVIPPHFGHDVPKLTAFLYVQFEAEMICCDGYFEIYLILRKLQLLPQAVAKRILYFVPREQLADCARVNRYWAYLVEELKAELAARLKIDADIEKLMEIMIARDTCNLSMDTFKTATENSFSALPSRHSNRRVRGNCSKLASQKSGATNMIKSILRDTKIKLPPIRNLAELSKRLDRRGAADDSLQDWCKAVLEQYKPKTSGDYKKLPAVESTRSSVNGVMDFRNIIFPCPLMDLSLSLPLRPPLCKDPTATSINKKKKSNINASRVNMQSVRRCSKRYNLWSRDFSSLYSAAKIASYKSPV